MQHSLCMLQGLSAVVFDIWHQLYMIELVLYGCAAETSVDVFWYVVQNFAIHAYIYELFFTLGIQTTFFFFDGNYEVL